MKKLLNEIQKTSITHGSLPFWSWNDRLEPEELRRQIRGMKELGMNGFFMHARGGLETEYLSEDWYNCINACIDEAEKQGMEAWSYDENGWPSGFAGGKLLENPDLQATWLELTTETEYPTDTVSENPRKKLLAVYVQDGNRVEWVKEPVENAAEYLVIRQRWDDSYVDTMNPAVSEQFLKETHEEYLKNVKAGSFGTSMPGFFTDEPQYYRWKTPWSEAIPEAFQKRYGYDVRTLLPALFLDCDGAKEFRYDYHYLCHRLFIENFAKPIYEWCHAHGCRLTGHAVEESVLFGQMWCCGGVMPFYEYEDIPGMDYLGRNLTGDLAPKQLGSVAAQLGKEKVMSEMFACCGWDVSPRELKRIAELQYVGGVNLMCQHLYAYSIHGQRKRDYPANYSEHLPWQKYLKPFNTYFNNLGTILSKGVEYANTLVIHPIHSAYLNYKRQEDRESIAELECKTRALSDLLSNAQIPYHYGDESMMARLAWVENDKIRVGKCTYQYVVIPYAETLDSSTVKLLQEFMRNGGKVWLYDGVPTRVDGRVADMSWLCANTTLEEIKNAAEVRVDTDAATAAGIRMQVRKLETGRLIYVVNLSENAVENLRVQVKACGRFARVDMMNLETSAVAGKRNADGSGEILLNLAPSESAILLEDEEAAEFTEQLPEKAKSLVFAEPFQVTHTTENAYTLDTCALSVNGRAWTEAHPIEAVRDELLRMRAKGRVALKFTFDADCIPETLHLAVEPLKNGTVTVNGTPVSIDGDWWLDRSFRTADIAKYVRKGQNEIVVSFDYFQRDYVYHVLYDGVSEALRNCLWFDTEVECVYLVGDFSLKTDTSRFVRGERNSLSYDGGFTLTAPIKPAFSELVTSGYPFFAGAVTAKATVNWQEGDGSYLALEGRWAVCEIRVNDADAGILLMETGKDLKSYLTEGKNEIELTIWNANRNLLGPHHREDPEPYGVSPKTFSFEGKWKDWQCEEYVPRYAFVSFGARI